MPNFNIWIRNPYPFRYQEYNAFTEALRRTYGGSPVYLKEWPSDWVSVDKVTQTQAKHIANVVKLFHLQAALKDKEFGYYGANDQPALNVEVELRDAGESRPAWAKSAEDKVY